jgi:molecular chaperone GrpE
MWDQPNREDSGEGVPAGPGKGGSPSETPSPAPVADVADVDLASLQKERDEYLELAKRTKADFENFRKRALREAAEAEGRGRADLAKSLVPVVDNLERALAAAGEEEDHLAQGVRLVHEELLGVLRRAGVERYSPEGESFDPEWHEAMLTRPGDAGRVLEVLEKGYRLDGHVIRPARVVVGAAEE